MKIKKVDYIEDLGGISSNDGRKIKFGKLFRSSCLADVKGKGARKISERLKINNIFDFRSPCEVEEKPDIEIEGIDYYHLPPLSSDENPSVNKKSRMKVLKGLMAKEGGTFNHLCDTYRHLISSPQAIESYKQYVNYIKENDGAMLWHCTQGKDRTGIGTMIVLSILDIPREEIIENYLAYNKNFRVKNFFIYIGMCMVFFSKKMAKSLNYLLTAQKEYINAAFDEIDQKFGSMNMYLRKALGLSDNDINTIKAKYLE